MNLGGPEDQKQLVSECAKTYLFNLIYIADEEDQGGFDYPLESKYSALEPLVEELLKDKVLAVADYEEKGERGQELVPGERGQAYLEDLIETSSGLVDQKLVGLARVRQAYYLAMNDGQLARIPESKGPWYKSLVDFEFYKSLVPEEELASMTEPMAEKKNSWTAPPQSVSEPQQPVETAPSFSAPPPRDFSEVEDSAIEIQSFEPEVEWPTRTYLYKKPAMIWAGITAFIVLIFGVASSFGVLSLVSAIATVFYAAKKVIISGDGIEVKSLLGTTRMALEDIDETQLVEEDGEPKSIKVISRQGDSVELSSWLDDLSGAVHLLKRLKQSS